MNENLKSDQATDINLQTNAAANTNSQSKLAVILIILLALSLISSSYLFYRNSKLKKQVKQLEDKANAEIEEIQQPTIVPIEQGDKPTETPINQKPIDKEESHEDLIPSDWISHTLNKPIGISFQTPKDYQVDYESDDDGGDWGAHIVSGKQMTITLCTGCDFVGGNCGSVTTHQCEVLKKQPLTESRSYSIYLFKETGEFEDLRGSIYLKNMTVEVRAETENSRMPSNEELEVLDLILLSIEETATD